MRRIWIGMMINLWIMTGAYSYGGKDLDITTFKINNVDVVWMEETKLPSYDVVFYFADGALGDQSGKSGETHLALNMITSGTRRYKKEEIADNLEYFGTSYGANILHEYSTYRVSGISRDMAPTIMKVCHLFNEANYPSDELQKEQKRVTTSFRQMIQDHEALANRAFRMLSLKDSLFAKPTEGTLSDIGNIKSLDLSNRLKTLVHKTNKKIYVNAPIKLKEEFTNIIASNCRFENNSSSFVRKVEDKNKTKINPKIILVTVPKANKAEIRIGRYLDSDKMDEAELAELAAGYLGGGFSAKLMEELRKKRGLVYSVYSYGAFQKFYGRSAIVTSTKNEQVKELLVSTKNIISETINGVIKEEDFTRMKNYIIGSYPFKFENSASYLNQLIFYDHIGKDYDRMAKFEELVRGYGPKDVAKKVNDLFKWDQQTIMVLGDKSLEKVLSSIGPLEVYSYERFL